MTHIFIVNPYSAQSIRTETLREKLSRIKNLKYFIFTTRSAGCEGGLVKKILHFFEGEKLRFYCCGGSGTMRNMLCGFDDISQAEVAFLPCGMSNDFLKVFEGDLSLFNNVEELIYGDVRTVDVISTNCGYALNTFSIGIDAVMGEVISDYLMLKSFSEGLPYIAAIIKAIFYTRSQKYIVDFDGKINSYDIAEMILGNGIITGGMIRFTDDKNVNDGKMSSMLIDKRSRIAEIKVLMDLVKGDMSILEKESVIGSCERFSVRRADGNEFTINLDGEIIKNVEVLDAHIIRNGLHFVVPKGIAGGVCNE